jgi:hypothetical protein
MFLLGAAACRNVRAFEAESLVAQADSPFVAYSLREAVKLLQQGRTAAGLTNLGGITRIAGLVYDRQNKDIVLVGLAAPELPAARLDDLAVALRSRLRHDEWPLVSIDPVEDTERTGLQRVRFDGHLEDSPFGADLLTCDVLLKRYSLQRMPSLADVPTYNTLLEDDIRQSVRAAGADVVNIRWCSPEEGATVAHNQRGIPIHSATSDQARFWFYAMEPYVPVFKQDLFCIKQLQVGVQSEHVGGATNEARRARARFADAWTLHFEEICRRHPDLRKLKVLYDLVAVAQAIRALERQPFVDYLVDTYRVAKVPTARTYPLEELFGLVERTDGLRHLVRISGGIQLRAEVRFMNGGDVTPLRSVVLNSRPSPTALTWRLPLQGWKMPNAKDLRFATGTPTASGVAAGGSAEASPGCSLSFQSVILDPARGSLGDDSRKRFFGFPPPPPPPPQLNGVSFNMLITDKNLIRDMSGELRSSKQKALESRPNKDSLAWPVK